tara:strand:- start:3405 stop:3683 length:279 start_codon:yes stop_codon:yes gene_type:complete
VESSSLSSVEEEELPSSVEEEEPLSSEEDDVSPSSEEDESLSPIEEDESPPPHATVNDVVNSNTETKTINFRKTTSINHVHFSMLRKQKITI